MESLSGEGWFLRTYGGGSVRSVVDVGANRGMFYRECVRNLPLLATYRGIEPHPVSFKVLEAMTRGDHIFLPFAATSERATLELFDHEDWDGSVHASVHKEVFPRLFQSDKVVSHKIQGIPLDELMDEGRLAGADVLKIDVEGHEIEVLKGARRFLETYKPKYILLEYNEHALITKYHLSDLEKLLPEYSFNRLLPSGLIPIERSFSLENRFFGYCNLAAIRRT
ncbi:MAG: hypothetical protein A2516_00830 [Alphaproteobacteria bacterium RIFOXYD12_FULL_60_8]|nr:MAG: hypothetical protein A2516_00830 [Alphaproteobacteria bacterium RIFOXYD12_FULL_60_8]